MNVLVTGGTGFLGRHVVAFLENAAHRVYTLARNNAHINCDLGAEIPVFDTNFELVIHCSGKAHSIPLNVEQRNEFFTANCIGTNNLLKGLEGQPVLPSYFIFMSSVSVYGREEGYLINEEAPLLAIDPYGLSKIRAEKIALEWCVKNNVICTILRLPLIAGINPPGNLKTMIKAINLGYYFNVVGGKSKKSMVLATDIASIIPHVSKIGGIYNLTDGMHPSFAELSHEIAKQLNRKKPLSIPMWLAKILAGFGDLIGTRSPINSDKLNKITSSLTFDDQKARKMIGWSPNPVLKEFKIV